MINRLGRIQLSNRITQFVHPFNITSYNTSTTSMSDVINVDYWSRRWEQGKSGWHNNQVNHGLISNIKSYYLQPSDSVNGTHNNKPVFLIPLCGKTIDMQYLNDYGYNVVGIEGVELSVQQYFSEQAEHYTGIQHNDIGNNIIRYTAVHNKSNTTINLYVTDIFNDKLTTDITGPLHLLFDRGMLGLTVLSIMVPYIYI